MVLETAGLFAKYTKQLCDLKQRVCSLTSVVALQRGGFFLCSML